MTETNDTVLNMNPVGDLNAKLSEQHLADLAVAPLSLLGEYEVLKAVNEALSQLFAHKEVNAALEAAFRIICEVTGCDGLMLFKYAQVKSDSVEAETVFNLRWTNGVWQILPLRVIYFPVEVQQVQQRFESMLYEGTTTVVFNQQVPPKLKAVLQELDVNAYISFRITLDGSPFGGMSLVTRESSIPYAEAYGKLLTSFAHSVGSFLAHKQAETRLASQRDYLRQIIDTSPQPIFVKDRYGVFTLVNQAMAVASGRRVEDMVGKPVATFMRDEEEAARMLAEDQEMLENGESKINIFRTLTGPSGEARYLQISKVPLIDIDNKAREIVTVFNDVTSLKVAEQKLIAEKQFSQSITSTMPDVVLIIHLEEQRITYHNLDKNVLGYDISNTTDLYAFTLLFIHPEDTHLIQNVIQALNQAPDCKVVEWHLRFKHKDGQWRWYHNRARVFSRHADARVKECLVLMQDVTEQKKNQIALQRSEGILKATINALPDLKFRVAKDGAYLDFYESNYENIQPYAPSDVILGKYVQDVMPPELARIMMEKVQQAVEERRVQVYEYEIPIAGQGIQYRETRVSPINDDEVIAVVRDISERKYAEEALQRSERRYRDFIKYSHEGIYYMNCGVPISIHLPFEEIANLFYENAYIEECNEAIARMYGTTVENLKGTKALTLHGGVHFEENKQSLRDFIDNGFRVADVETIELTVDGELCYFLNDAVGIIIDEHLIGFWGTQSDITQKKLAEKELQESQNILKAVVNALPDLKFRMSKDGIFLNYYQSEAESEATLMSPTEFLYKKIQDVLPSDVAELGAQAIQKAIQSKQLQVFEYVLPYYNDVRYYEGRVSAVSDSEAIVAIRNITEHKKSQIALQEKLRELDEKNKELMQYIESNFQLENFAYIASHDLREPVRTMHSFAQLIKRKYADVWDEESNRHLGFIIQGAENMNQLIDDLLMYSRVNSETHSVELIHLPDLLQEVLQSLTHFIQDEKAAIHIGELPITIQANRVKIRQVFQNLWVNAIKFHKPNTAPIVHLNGIEQEDYWLFEIKDNGIGVPMNMQEKIFQLFKKIHYTQEHHGTGIGLALCQRIVEQHHGEIWVESQPDEGSAFYFTIKKPS